MNTQNKVLTAAALLSAALGSGYLAGSYPKGEVRELAFCDLPDARCGSLDELPADVQASLMELFWCCPYDPGDCYHVAVATACDPDAEFLVHCVHGQSIGQSGDGVSGFECFD